MPYGTIFKEVYEDKKPAPAVSKPLDGLKKAMVDKRP